MQPECQSVITTTQHKCFCCKDGSNQFEYHQKLFYHFVCGLPFLDPLLHSTAILWLSLDILKNMIVCCLCPDLEVAEIVMSAPSDRNIDATLHQSDKIVINAPVGSKMNLFHLFLRAFALWSVLLSRSEHTTSVNTFVNTFWHKPTVLKAVHAWHGYAHGFWLVTFQI